MLEQDPDRAEPNSLKSAKNHLAGNAAKFALNPIFSFCFFHSFSIKSGDI